MEDKEFDYTKATKKRIVWAIIVLMISIISSVLIERTLFRYVHTPFPIITPSPYSRITRTPYPTIPTPDAYETIISPTNSPTPSFIPTEHTTGTATTRSSSSNASSANLEFEYPPHMRRRESQIVILRISLNGLSLSNRSIQRIPSEADNPLVFNIYRESIYYGEKPIRATLRSSSALMIKPMMQSQDDQVFYIESEGMSWGWIIEAADHDATVPIILSLYHGYSSLAFWTTIANIDISGVAFPTETLVPTSTFNHIHANGHIYPHGYTDIYTYSYPNTYTHRHTKD